MENEIPGDQFSEEVEDRLQNLFGEDELSEAAEPNAAVIKPHPLRDLKAVILAIDWEITDEVMTSFGEQVALLQNTYRNDKIVLVFLQLLGSIGEYIRTHLGQSHPDAFKILNSLFAELERIVLSEDLTEVEKKKILAVELGKYKRLKSQLAASKPGGEDRRAATPTTADRSAAGGAQPELIKAIEDLKLFVQQEFRAIRDEIRKLSEAIGTDSRS
ncbi:MAG: hypothetical protein U5R30_03090 [Deltaproteobacteria bacterium]|nr:hypothetical protein [Deltaproteobacteria bacterium]